MSVSDTSVVTLQVPKKITVEFNPLSNLLILNKDGKQVIVQLSKNIHFTVDSNKMHLRIKEKTKQKLKQSYYKTFLNTNLAIIKQNLKGLQQPFKLKLRLIGIGFKCGLLENVLVLKIGHSHTCNVNIPQNIKIHIPNATTMICSCIYWDELTNFAAQIKRIKTVDPYKGKGIFLEHEYINLRKKEGKKNKK
jgi:ribosomal protein L6P/L9E